MPSKPVFWGSGRPSRSERKKENGVRTSCRHVVLDPLDLTPSGSKVSITFDYTHIYVYIHM